MVRAPMVSSEGWFQYPPTPDSNVWRCSSEKKRFFDLVVTLDNTRECRWKYIGREFEPHLFTP